MQGYHGRQGPQGLSLAWIWQNRNVVATAVTLLAEIGHSSPEMPHSNIYSGHCMLKLLMHYCQFTLSISN